MHSFETGDLIRRDAGLYEVVSANHGKLALRSVEGAGDIELTDADWQREYARCALTILNQNANRAVTSDNAFLLMPGHLRERALVRLSYAKAMDKVATIGELTNDEVMRIGRSVAAELKETGRIGPDGSVPSHASLRRWYARWMRAGRDIFSLVDNFQKRGRPRRRLCTDAEQLLLNVLKRHYLTRQRLPATEVYKLLIDAIEEENSGRIDAVRLKRPCYRTLVRRIADLDFFLVAVARRGRDWAMAHCKIAVRGRRIAKRPNEVWEVDATPADIQVLKLNKKDVTKVRVYLTIIIDQYSRCVVGFYLSFKRPSLASVCRALHMAMFPKTWLVTEHPEVRGEWPCHGVPAVLVCDNAMENHSKTFAEFCAVMGIEVVYTARKTPQGKPHVERLIRTINEFFHRLPGTTFSNPTQRAGYPSGALTRLTLKQVESLLLRFIVDQYLPSFHSSILCSPLSRWQQGVEEDPVRLPRQTVDPVVLCMHEEVRSLQKYGIQFDYLIYHAPEFQELWRPNKSIRLQFRYDEEALDYILVRHPKTRDYFRAHCVNMPEYAAKVTRTEHKAILQKLKKTGKANVDIDRIAKLASELYDDVRKMANSRGRAKSPPKVAQRHDEAPVYHEDVDPLSEYEGPSDAVSDVGARPDDDQWDTHGDLLDVTK